MSTPKPALVGPTRVQHLPLERLDFDDETFRFRAALRIGPLRASIASQGQQLPIVVRKRGGGRPVNYQIVSGFRRATAMRALGAPTIAAIVREDLEDDEVAFRASVLENCQRKTYSDLDRALVIKSYEDRGYGSVDVAMVMGLSKRQKNNLKSLLNLPDGVREAIDDPDSPFTATHGLVLKQLAGRYPDLSYSHWVRVVADSPGGLSVSRLKRAVNAHHRSQEPRATVGSLFRRSGTRLEQGVFRLQPLKIDVARLSDEEKAGLREELSQLLAVLR